MGKEKNEIRVKAGKKSKRKGGAGERWVVKRLKELGIIARRTAQFNGKSKDSESDVVIENCDLHIEVKNEKNVTDSSLLKYIKQVYQDAPHKTWVICFNSGNGQWKVLEQLSGYFPERSYDNYEIRTFGVGRYGIFRFAEYWNTWKEFNI